MRVLSGMVKAVMLVGVVSALSAGLGGAVNAARAAPAIAAAVSVSSPWSQTDYNAAQSRANLTERTLTRATVARLRSLRSMAAPPPSPSDACASQVVAPLLAGGSLYGAMGDWVTKFNPATGRVIWRRNINNPAVGPLNVTSKVSLAVASGVVVLGAVNCLSQSAPPAFIETFNAATGRRGWAEGFPDSPIYHLVVSGRYIVTAGDSAEAGNVVAVYKLTDGSLVWQHVTSECPSFLGAVAVVAGLVVSYSCNAASGQSLVASRLTTGARVWSRTGGNWQLQRGDTDGAASRHLYAVNPRGAVVALDPRTGKTLYSLARASEVLAVDSIRAYAQCDSGGGVCAYNTTSGRMRWEVRTTDPADLAAEAGGVLYLDLGLVLNSGTGQTITELWSSTIGGPIRASALAVGDGRIAAVTDPRVLDLYGLPAS